MRLTGLIAVMITGLLLSACATMNKNECAVADWQAIGYDDGQNGASSSRLQSHRKACAKHGVSTDFSMYQAGYDEGVKRFCTDRIGFAKGKSGYRYTGICPADLEPTFLKGYNLGKEFYALNQKIRSAENSLRLKEQQIEDLQSEVDALELEMLADSTTSDRRAEVLKLRDDKLQELTLMEEDLMDLKLAVASAEGELKQLEAKSPY